MFNTLRNYSKYVILLIVLAMVITGGLYGYGSYLNRGAAQSASTANVIASVNGSNISQEEYYNALQQQAPQSQLTRSQVVPYKYSVLETLIERDLVMQRGEELGIEAAVTDKDVDDYLQKLLDSNKMTEDDLKTYLANQGSSLTQFRRDLKAGLEQNDILKQTQESTYSNLQVSEEEIAQAYEKADIQVIVKNFTEDNKEEASKQINEALASIKEGKNFTAVVKEYSDLKYNDGKVGKIGRENNFVPAAIVDKAMKMEKGQVSDVIEADQSFYIVKLQDKTVASGEDYNKAKEDLKKSLLTDKQNKAFSNWLDNAKAEAEIEIMDPTLRGYRALRDSNYDQAISDFNTLVEQNPTPANYNYLAQAYSGAGQTDQARATYEKAIADYPDDWEIHFDYGTFLAGMEEPDKEKAVSLLDKAAELSGEDFMAHYQLYLAYSQLGEKEKAEAEMTKLNELQEKLQAAQEEAKQKAQNKDEATVQNGTDQNTANSNNSTEAANDSATTDDANGTDQ